jgi:acyl-CoA synthetase (AMP-forming)/AMP-acid ligase II
MAADVRSATLHGRLADVVLDHAAQPALHDGERTSTYGEVMTRAERFASAIAAHSAPGDRVALVAWNGPWWIDACVGVPMAGRVLAMISPRLTATEIATMLDTVEPSLVIVDETVAEPSSFVADGRRSVGLGWWCAEADRSDRPSVSPATDPGAVAWLVFTSGTTAAPKAAALTHRSLLAAVAATIGARPEAVDDVYLFPFPQWHVAIYNVMCRLLDGREAVLHGRFDPRRLIDDVARHRVTSMSVAATMLDAILDVVESDPTARASLRSLTDIYYGAAPMPITVLRRAASMLPVRFWQGYGMTELSGNAVFLSADDHVRGLAGEPRLLRAAGHAAPGVELRIAAGDDTEVPVDGIGEIQVRAAQVMAGYWGNDAATAAALTKDGWLRTGDVGTLDGSGLLAVIDRKKDIIITGGENVSAREVEEALRAHPDVADVAVVGVPDPRWGENVCAVVVPVVGRAIDGDDLRAFARSSLAGFKVPRHVVTRGDLPVNASGKVVKADLRAWLTEHAEELDVRR